MQIDCGKCWKLLGWISTSPARTGSALCLRSTKYIVCKGVLVDVAVLDLVGGSAVGGACLVVSTVRLAGWRYGRWVYIVFGGSRTLGDLDPLSIKKGHCKKIVH